MQSLVEIKLDSGILHVIFKGNVTLAEASTAKKIVAQADGSASRPSMVVFDMSMADQIDSPALGRLLNVNSLPVEWVSGTSLNRLFAVFGISTRPNGTETADLR